MLVRGLYVWVGTRGCVSVRVYMRVRDVSSGFGVRKYKQTQPVMRQGQ